MASPRGIRLTDQQRVAWLRLIRSENVGPATFRDLLNHFGSAAASIEALPDLAVRSGRRISIAGQAEAEREIAALARLGGRLVAIGEPDYPPWLREIDAPPPLISIRGGSGDLLRQPMIAIVGARSASVAGRKMAQILARGLGEAGFAIASGLARGIDAAAHEAALDGGTVAVFAGGLDRLYPPENAALAEAILERGGAHLSEMPLGWEPRARDFPRRNRLVSGMSVGALVIEAAERSGSLITARLAGEQGRIVFAVPGSPLDPRAAGTNRLIKEGAHLVTTASDVLEVVGPMIGHAFVAPPNWSEPEGEGAQSPGSVVPDDRDRALLIEALGPTPVQVDELIRFTGLRAATVQVLLIELDLAGRIERHPGQRVALIG
ncbi:DNA-processing protein DprA [Kaistia dalseonensis]|uniref:DNA processing protein n=1 Tax=Kaistia dalseonensis TaxID=410840 RepID=A0ABU0H6S9_9HYPH|nr:DNA-processing protein DprA [Kaistia dalseonensis]MCX5495434.1 DNA-processing protein DprA [Kaistia dalseonensis]MDQ0438023.1 DNA processing protein [Kaistia dalseonensis]